MVEGNYWIDLKIPRDRTIVSNFELSYFILATNGSMLGLICFLRFYKKGSDKINSIKKKMERSGNKFLYSIDNLDFS